MKKWQKGLIITGAILVVLGTTYGICASLPRDQNYEHKNPLLKESETPLLIAHGGGNREFPDNTLEAFYNAYSCDENMMLETDVSITKDNVILLSHDISLDRKTNVTGLIQDWNYSDLISQKVDFGYENPVKEVDEAYFLDGERVKYLNGEGKSVSPTDVSYPDYVVNEEGIIDGRDTDVFLATTLEDLLIHFPKNRINVEIKQSGETGLKAFKEVLNLLEKYDAFDRVVLAGFHDEIYDEFVRYEASEEANDKFMFSPSVSPVIKFYILHATRLDAFFKDKISVFQLPMEQSGINLATKSLVNTAHKHNIAVHYWTINDVEDMEYLIDIGADGIMTDYPHRLKSVYESY